VDEPVTMKCSNIISLLSSTAMVYTQGFGWLDNHLEVGKEAFSNTTIRTEVTENEGDEKTTQAASLTGPATVLQDNKDVMMDTQKPSKSRSAIYLENNPHKKKVYSARCLENYHKKKKIADELAAKGDTSLQEARKRAGRIQKQKQKSRHAVSHEAERRQKRERELTAVYEKFFRPKQHDALVFGVDYGGDDDGGATHNDRSDAGQLSLPRSTERQREITVAERDARVFGVDDNGDDDGGATHNNRYNAGQLSLARSTQRDERVFGVDDGGDDDGGTTHNDRSDAGQLSLAPVFGVDDGGDHD
jgi:polyhydroxyalkanoate synthesis regulator phasin